MSLARWVILQKTHFAHTHAVQKSLTATDNNLSKNLQTHVEEIMLQKVYVKTPSTHLSTQENNNKSTLIV